MKVKIMVKYRLSPITLTKTQKLESEAWEKQLIHQQFMQNVTWQF